jgi:glycosyltransferase involved in cell wall biosynthesis
MKILLVADAVGGVFTHAVELARALAAAGVRVVLATEGAELTPDQRRAVDALEGVVHEGRRFRLEWMEDPWDDVAASGRWLLGLEERDRPHVVHLCAYAHGALPFRAPKLVAGHSCVLSWFDAVKGIPAPRAWDRYRAAVRAGIQGADAIAAPSAWMARALLRYYGPMIAPVVVRNGRDPARFVPGPKEDIVFAAGRVWDEGKNVAALVRCAPRLPWPVVIAGERWPPLSPRGAGGEDRGEGGNTLFLGHLPEDGLAGWLSRAAIFAHPARYEPFGLAVLEAALSGCALVLGDIPSLRELWDGAAEFAPPDDDEAIVDRVAALAHDAGRRRALAARARARALALTPARMAAGYLALYRAIGRRAAAEGPRP